MSIRILLALVAAVFAAALPVGAIEISGKAIAEFAVKTTAMELGAKGPRWDITAGGVRDVAVDLDQCRLVAGRIPSNAHGSFRVSVKVRCAGKTAAVRSVAVRVRRLLHVAVARRKLRRHEIIHPDIFSLEDRWKDAVLGRPIKPEGSSWETSRIIRAGSVLTENNTRLVPDVRRGRPVVLVAAVGRLRVKMSGIALRDGYPGEIVRAKTLPGGKIISGRVMRGGRLAVDVGIASN